MNARPRFHIVGRDEPVSPYRTTVAEKQHFDSIRRRVQQREQARRDARYALMAWIAIFAASIAFWAVVIAWVAAKEGHLL